MTTFIVRLGTDEAGRISGIVEHPAWLEPEGKHGEVVPKEAA